MATSALDLIDRPAGPSGPGGPMTGLRRLSSTQQAVLGVAFAAVVGAVYLISRMASAPTMGILYSDLEPQAAAEVADQLESRGIEYELTDGGRVIWVPRNQVATTRLDMSSAGLPDSSSGWSVLDAQGITSSEFDQRVGYQRAMEGELARTIAVIEGVASANVHLVIPEQDLFVDDEIRASASVLVQLEGDEPLAPNQVQAIVNLVASAVEGLQASDVTVTDGAGRLLAGGDEEGVAGIESDSRLRMTDDFEADLERRLTNLLTAVVGPGRAVVTVAADLDFDAVTTTEERFEEPVDADGATLPRAETTRTEQYDGGGAEDQGVVDIETEILEGPAPGGDGRTNYQLDERDVSYALNSVVTSTARAPGSIRSLSVAVVIDEEALEQARQADIETMVSAAVGADPERGDVVAVNLLPFDASVADHQAAADAADAEAGAEGESSSLPMIRTAGASVLALVVLLLGLFLLRRSSRRRVIDSVELSDLDMEQLAAGDDRGLGVGIDEVTGEPIERRIDDTTQIPIVTEPNEDDLFDLIANQPDDIAAVLRQWLSQPEGAGR